MDKKKTVDFVQFARRMLKAAGFQIIELAPESSDGGSTFFVELNGRGAVVQALHNGLVATVVARYGEWMPELHHAVIAICNVANDPDISPEDVERFMLDVQKKAEELRREMTAREAFLRAVKAAELEWKGGVVLAYLALVLNAQRYGWDILDEYSCV